MINNRTQLDKETIDWKSVAFGVGKYRRKTVGFGKYNKKTREYEDEIYLRELSIIDGGIGCALWDAAIILARWMRENQSLFENKVCIELGSGVGLPGILASRWCSRVYLTDYIENILLNLEYNIHLNTTIDDEDERNDELVDKINLKKKMKDTAIVKMLNWYEIDNVKMEQADIILGSELTYTGNEKTINSLVKVVDKLLKKDGIFIEILSDNRDGVSLFCKKIAEIGFDSACTTVDKYMKGNFGTKQRPETYKLYFWTRKSDKSKMVLAKLCESTSK